MGSANITFVGKIVICALCLAYWHFIHVVMRDEKEGRQKQARSNKQQGKATCIYMIRTH